MVMGDLTTIVVLGTPNFWNDSRSLTDEYSGRDSRLLIRCLHGLKSKTSWRTSGPTC